MFKGVKWVKQPERDADNSPGKDVWRGKSLLHLPLFLPLLCVSKRRLHGETEKNHEKPQPREILQTEHIGLYTRRTLNVNFTLHRTIKYIFILHALNTWRVPGFQRCRCVRHLQTFCTLRFLLLHIIGGESSILWEVWAEFLTQVAT